MTKRSELSNFPHKRAVNRSFLQLASALKIHPERAKYVMEELQSLKLLRASYNYREGTSWLLSAEGRAALVKRNLL